MLREYAQGLAQSAAQPVADFLAPAVPVATSVGRFKSYTEKDRFRVPNTLRAIGGRATELGFAVSDKTYNCQPHALDYPIDRIEEMESEAVENAMMEGARMISEVAALAHEQVVINAAVAQLAGGATAVTWSSGSADPVNDIDTQLLAVIKNAAYGSAMGTRVLFGASAWRVFKNNASVRGKFVVGSGARTGSGGAGLAIPTEEMVGGLLVGNPECRVSYMVQDANAEGKAQSMSFLLDNSVIVFASRETPDRRDPSFMKTFRLAGQFMVPGAYVRDDNRVEVAKFDWSEDVQITNPTAAALLTVS
jgi:hypothetical protein